MNTKTRKAKALDRYLELVRAFPLKAIRNDREHAAATVVMEKLVLRPDGSLDDGEQDYLEALTTLVYAYEQEHHKIDTSHLTALDMLKFFMEQHDMSPSDLGKLIGSASLASMILKGQRQISKAKILLLAKHFGVDPGVFL